MKAFVIAESHEAQKELCGGARTLADEVVLATIGQAPTTGIADKAYELELPASEAFENAWDTVAALVKEVDPDIVLVESTARLKIIGGRIAAQANTSMINDVVSFDGQTAESLYFGGLASIRRLPLNAMAVYSSNGSVWANATAFGTETVEQRPFIAPKNPLKLLGTHPVPREGADLGRAAVVVGAGRGFGKEEDLELARKLADAVHGELACSRPLAENEKWIPKSRYLGVSGRMISPKVYFAVGISGQMQHMVGVHNSDIIIAINKDKNAPVFNQADYGLVADLREAIPALLEELS